MIHLIFGVVILVAIALLWWGLSHLVEKHDVLDSDFGLLVVVVTVIFMGLAGFTGLIVAGYGLAKLIADLIVWIGGL